VHLRPQLPEDEPLPAGGISFAQSPDEFLFAVAGGIGIKAAYLPAWPGGSRAVTIAIPIT
jgi:hypothetical protein